MLQRLRGWLTVWVIPLLVVGGSTAALIVYWGRYSDPLAVHWGVSGEANGTLPPWLYAVATIGGMVLAWWGLISATRTGPNAPLAAVVYFIIGLLAAVNAQVLYFNLDAATWEEARNLDPITFGGVMLIGILAGGLGWLLGGGRKGVPEDVELELPETTATTCSGRSSNLWMALIAVIPIGFAFVVEPIWSGVLIVVAVLVIIFAFVEVDVDESRVAVGLGPVGIPRRNYRMDEITHGGAIEVQPLAYGGWGWRIRPGRCSYIIRGGQAIRVERANGVAIGVTVDGAPEGAAVIDSLARTRRYG